MKERKNMKTSMLGPVALVTVVGSLACLGGCASNVEEPSAKSQQGLAETPPPEATCIEAEPFTDLGDEDPATGGEDPATGGGGESATDPGAGGEPDEGDGSDGLTPQTIRPLAAKTACESSCDAAFPSAPGVYGSCSNIFLTACYVACRGADSAKAACASLRGGRAPRGWVKALQRICAISGL
jgi:hypothetical protein